MVSTARFSHMVSLIYAAALSTAAWEEAITQIHRELTPGGSGEVRSTSLAFSDGDFRLVLGKLLHEAEEPYRRYYGRIDHVLDAVEHGPVGVVRTSEELIAPGVATEFHADWMRPNDIEQGLFVRLTDEPQPASFIVAGSRSSRTFNTEDRIELVTLLVPHLRQALDTNRHVTGLSEQAVNLSGALDSVSHGVVVVTEGLKLVEFNTHAEQLLSHRDGLRIDNGALTAAMPVDAQNLIRLAAQALTSEGVRRGGATTCQRVSGKRAYVLHVVPLDPASVGMKTRPLAAVLIVDPSRQPQPAEQLMRDLYRLTKAEAAVANLVLSGEGVQAISDRLSLSPTTVRTHLRAIFHKTGTHRQAELVRLLSTISP